jgi:hypothetical protein
MLPLLLADFVNGHDVRMLQRRSRGGLSPETLHGIVAAERAEREQLEGNQATQAHLPRFIDDPHAALADLLH